MAVCKALAGTAASLHLTCRTGLTTKFAIAACMLGSKWPCDCIHLPTARTMVAGHSPACSPKSAVKPSMKSSHQHEPAQFYGGCARPGGKSRSIDACMRETPSSQNGKHRASCRWSRTHEIRAKVTSGSPTLSPNNCGSRHGRQEVPSIQASAWRFHSWQHMQHLWCWVGGNEGVAGGQNVCECRYHVHGTWSAESV